MISRTEKKIFDSLKKNLNRLKFLNLKLQHPTRIINSIYFDRLNFFHFNRSEEGTTPRSKFRLRNYNNERNYFLEVKSKINNRSIKKITNLKNFNLLEVKKKIISLYGENVHPVLKVSYKRKYFVSKDDRARYTLDYDIVFSKLNLHSKVISRIKENFSVIEVKKDHEMTLSILEKKYGGMITRYSKYCEGIKKFYL